MTYTKAEIELERDGLREYLPTNNERSEIWKYIFSKKKELNICNYDDISFDGKFERYRMKEFEKNKRKIYNIYRIEDNKFFVEVLCLWASYQGNYEFFTYENSNNEVILKRLLLRRFSRNTDGSLSESYSESVGGMPAFSAKHKTLRIFSRAGGGDCGSNLVEYQYENNELSLVSVRENYECLKHQESYSPNQYPIIYPVPSQ
ncbi:MULTISPECIES: hypothetical protein [unclassified Microcystis]|uniref:hypothetical protein n=1 Tax=unclassified Microcystis TaxID=2643300 RepID=UPI00258414B7|nr:MULTISPECIES: hypothetical protein [unclassified Microcystis]MCA2815559.1 hypothetical protein [Microcystis sp. M085S1]MCA6532993.1 hypothetical protein [Pseudanabaena sp. M176S2SP2A07QC]MCA6539678.1 hypothetical protein [Pseudanabaena sp. M037S2SP2A07QC]MCA6542309.1 hypothetical protein [Pseudanabaena sp. M074S1SP2A07QC]MCA6547206.1 hypothetical protein [Pseudanabaena sp. M152S2SP2A07QC]MCA6567061.1 hypothetical protein [Pseudanabaena sp. M151S2SP2A07QC]MCA6571480.1 hypothetical protein 